MRGSTHQQTIIVIIILITDVLSLGDNHSFAHINDKKVQTWTNPKDNLKIQFTYLPENPVIDTFTTLNFSVQDLRTGEHLKDFTARVVVTNGQRLFKFENVTVPNGDFSVKYLFPDDGTHQVILRINSKNLFALASFQVFVPHQSPPSLLNDITSLIIIICVIAVAAFIGILSLRRRL